MIRIISILALVVLSAFVFACGDDDDDDGANGDGATPADGETVSEADQLCSDIATLTAAINEFDAITPDTTLEELDLLEDNLTNARQSVVSSAAEAFEAEVVALEASLDTLEDDLQAMRDDGATDSEVTTAQESAATAREDAEALTTSATC
jgi:hypothetical protein